ncbi:MAG: hypothetical protein SWJ54_23955, partial [Cyanobacteriota bacterium]|nr:hypothetical protein [Cyanobacteriota bacterium]
MNKTTKPVSPQQPVSSESNSKVVELEVKLKRAYKTIRKLRTRVAELDSQQELLTPPTVRLPSEYPQLSSERRYRSRSHPPILALVSVASLALVIGGLGAIAKFFFPHLFPGWIKLIPLRVTAATSSPLSLVSTQATSTSASSPQSPSISELVYNVTE